MLCSALNIDTSHAVVIYTSVLQKLARPMGFEPTFPPVTGEYHYQASPGRIIHLLSFEFFNSCIKFFKKLFSYIKTVETY